MINIINIDIDGQVNINHKTITTISNYEIEYEYINNTLNIITNTNLLLNNKIGVHTILKYLNLEKINITGNCDVNLEPVICSNRTNIISNSSGTINIKKAKFNKLIAELNGCGSININSIICNHVKVFLKGSGNIKLESNIFKKLKIDLQGSGSISGFNTKCDYLVTKLFGSGIIIGFRTIDIDSYLIGSGIIDVYSFNKPIVSKIGAGIIKINN